MLADLICSAWRRQSNLDPDAYATMAGLLKGRIYPVLQVDDLERIELLLAREEHGLALVDLLFLLADAPKATASHDASRKDVIARLACLEPQFLDAALQLPLNRIELELNMRKLETTEQLVKLLREEILRPLKEALSEEQARRLEWADAHALSLALAACNHRGAICKAESYLEELAPLRQQVASHFECLPLSMAISFNEAVHWSNTCDFVKCHQSMLRLGEEMSIASSLLLDAVRHDPVHAHSDAVGKALGTALQAAICRARRDPSLYPSARLLSERAFQEFDRDDDRRRQAGYRCQLEADAGNLDEARRWLGLSLNLEQPLDLQDIVHIASTQSSAFSLMHVAQLWEACARAKRSDLARDVELAWRSAGLEEDERWRRPDQHPLPLILWKWGSALAHSGHREEAEERLGGAIDWLERDPDNVTLHIVSLGARCDRIALICSTDGLRCNRYRRSVRAVRDLVHNLIGPEQPASQRAYFACWIERLATLDTITDRTVSEETWRALAWDVPY